MPVHPRAPSRFRQALALALDALAPRRCPSCDEVASARSLCGTCLETLEPPPEGAAALAAFAYGGALAEAVRKAKFHPDEARARALLPLFTKALLDEAGEQLQGADLITFVPLHWRRLRTRGFDLAAMLATALAPSLGLPCEQALTCSRFDAPLSRGASVKERARLVTGRYRPAGTSLAGRRALLVDDVVTTGATLGEAARVLLAAGAAEVVPVALAATPLTGGERPLG